MNVNNAEFCEIITYLRVRVSTLLLFVYAREVDCFINCNRCERFGVICVVGTAILVQEELIEDLKLDG